MKKQIVNIALVSMIALGAVSCKEKENEAIVSEAKEVAESPVTAIKYAVDTETSVINWNGSKPGKTHTGTVKLSSGTIAAVDGVLQSGNFVIDMNSITDTDMEGDSKASLEAHLKGTVEGKEKDFFNVTEYPTATFELTGIAGEGENVTVTGNLTIKGKTENIGFPAAVSVSGDEVLLKSEPFKLDRTLWGVNFMSKSIFDDLKDKFIDDEIGLAIDLVAKKG